MICPFCSLLCDADDLDTIPCDRRSSSLVQFASRRMVTPTHLEARQSEVKLALQRAKCVLVTGRIASVDTARAAVAFAAKHSATLDCAESGHVFKNVLAIQRSGLNSVSIAEARDHSDLFIVIGDDAMLRAAPRMPFALSNDLPNQRTVLLLGEFGQESIRGWKHAGFDTWAVQCELKNVPTALSQWSRWSDQVWREQTTSVDSTGGLIASPLLERMACAQYTTLLWCAENLAMAEADLWVERLLIWIASRNEKLRCAALPWTSTDGTFQQVCTWLTGFPGRIYFRDGIPEYDPLRNSYEHWIERISESGTPESVVVLIDETIASMTYLRPLEWQWLEKSLVIELTGDSASFPTWMAGFETTADMFRADQTLLAHVEPTRNQPKNGKPASFWLEELSS